MRVIVVGLGVQGYKRRKFAGPDFVAAVDPVNAEAQYRDVREVPLKTYDAVLACIPDGPKIEVLSYLLSHGKHVLVEKPLWAESDDEIVRLEHLAQSKSAVCYTAYNHRFEPHYVRMRDLVRSGELGRIYRCRMFYGNGTARLVRESAWRDEGAGVLPDLGSH
ncbi:MAG: Gfo/Idh/MocA family protein, partial [Burkholderiales bacterium]